MILLLGAISLSVAVLAWTSLRSGDHTLQRDVEKMEPAASIQEEKVQAVNFCGITYYAQPIILYDIEMVARIAEIATAQPETLVCENLESNFRDSAKLLPVEVLHLPSDPSGIYDYLRIDFLQFSFDPEKEQIFLDGLFDGTPELFGTFQ